MNAERQSAARARPAGDARTLPADGVLLPLDRGALLVSRSHAVFCRIPPESVEAVRRAVANRAPGASLKPALLAELDRHGFFDDPRGPSADAPSVQLQLTNACNLTCGYCCTNSGRARATEVTFERMRRVVQAIPSALGLGAGVALLGGEPLLVPWAVELADEILDRGLRLTLFTNGVPLADEPLARRVAALVARGAQVRVSLAGPTAATCDALSGAARFEAAIRGVAQLAACGAAATVDLMLTPGTVDEIIRELPALRRRLPPGTAVTLGVLYRSGREDGAHLFRSRAELDAALDRIAFEAGETVPGAMPSPRADRRDGCPCALGRHLHVRSDGVLFNCFKMEERVGDLATEDFGSVARAVRAAPHLATALPVCAPCPLATLCGGGCRSENILYTGDADRPPCGPWRVRVMSELLAEDRVAAVEWPVGFLVQEAEARGIATPAGLAPVHPSRHLLEV